METVKITYAGETVRMQWDGSQASAPIRVDGVATQYQTANARHRTDWAVLLVAGETWPDAEWPSAPRNGSDPIEENEAWDALAYEAVDLMADARKWAAEAEAGDYLVEYEDDGRDDEDDTGSRCGLGDDELDELGAILAKRNLRLVADDRGLVAEHATTADDVVAAIANVAHARADGDDVVRIVGYAPDSSEYDGGTEPGGAWDEECDRLIAEVREALPAGWSAEWSDDDVRIEREAR